MRRPNKPHRAGYEDEEDCVGYYGPDEAERRGCHNYRGGCSDSDLRISDTSTTTGRQCYETWKAKDEARQKAEWDAKTPEEKAQQEAMIKGLRELY